DPQAGDAAEVIMKVVDAAQERGGCADHLAPLGERGVLRNPLAHGNHSGWRFGQQKRLHAPVRNTALAKCQQARSADAVAPQPKHETRSAHFRRSRWSASEPGPKTAQKPAVAAAKEQRLACSSELHPTPRLAVTGLCRKVGKLQPLGDAASQLR